MDMNKHIIRSLSRYSLPFTGPVNRLCFVHFIQTTVTPEAQDQTMTIVYLPGLFLSGGEGGTFRSLHNHGEYLHMTL
jgi:hypothetical protein